MRKNKNVLLAIQLFCILLLIMSDCLEPSITQVAYCFTVFSSPLLLLAFGEIAFFNERNYLLAAGIVVFESCITILFVGAMVTGMRMYTDSLTGFSKLLLVYCLAALLSVVERVATRVNVQ